MNRLVHLTVRLILAWVVTLLILSWIVSRWYSFGIQSMTSGTQLFIHVDSGGWFFDARRLNNLPAASFIHPYADKVAKTPDRNSPSKSAGSVIDRFDMANRWSASLPGVRFLREDSIRLPRGGMRFGFAVRHWLMLLTNSLAAFLIVKIGNYHQGKAACHPSNNDI